MIELNLNQDGRADEEMRQIKLDFQGIDERFRENKQFPKIDEVFLHNEDTRLTLIQRGACSYTFPLPKYMNSGEDESEIKYYLESDDLIGVIKKNEAQEDDLYI